MYNIKKSLPAERIERLETGVGLDRLGVGSFVCREAVDASRSELAEADDAERPVEEAASIAGFQCDPSDCEDDVEQEADDEGCLLTERSLPSSVACANALLMVAQCGKCQSETLARAVTSRVFLL